MRLDTHALLSGAGLRVISAVGVEGSFSGAAARLGLTPAAVSQMTHRLEQRVGTPLVVRHGRQVRLTEAGQILARYADPVLGALARAEEELLAVASPGRLTGGS